MCGIAGYLNFDGQPASVDMVARMGQAIAHRGPDGHGVFVDGPCALAHRRLSIIDLSSAGKQPMVSFCGRYVLSYNGEIYNFQELRSELESCGHRFRSRTDSEALLEGVAEWGLGVLSRLNGMFAFAVWDKKARTLTLARDRYGIKPLYYTCSRNRIVFGSEVKAILQHSACAAKIDHEALIEYFTYQNYFTDRTLFKDIRLLQPGCSIQYSAESLSNGCINRYWDFNFSEPDVRMSGNEYVEELDHLFQQAVRRQQIADVPVGAYLSGGIDSGAIAAVAARRTENLKSFTVGFDLSSASGLELIFDERRQAEHMSYLFGTEQYEMVLKAGDMERVLPKLVWHLEEPRVGQSYPNYYAAQLASKFGKVVLGGTGSDELFGGYPWRYYRAVVNYSFDHYIDKYYKFWQRLIPNSEIKSVFRPIWEDVSHVWTRDIFRDVFHQHADTLTRPEDYVNHSLYFEAKTFLHGLFVVEDKLSMAHGLESRVPFMDNDLVDFAAQVPVRMKLGKLSEVIRLNENEPGPKTRKYYEKTQDGKLLLRQVLRRYVPEDVSEGIKQGFSAPDASWFRGESIDYVRSVIFDDNARIWDFMDKHAVQQLVQEHLDGTRNRRLLVWSLLSVEQWCKTFLSDADMRTERGTLANG